MKPNSREVFFDEMVDFLIRKHNFGGRVRKERSGKPPREKRGFQIFLQSPLSGEKKVRALFFSRKNEHLMEKEDAQISASARAS